jgi:ubiquinone/menaquinone biosynthesis C-methylase UbiE
MHATKQEIASTAAAPAPAPAPDYQAIKAKQRATWSSGDYGRIGVTLQIVGEELCESAGVSAADRVLDVAAGSGNASLAAARRFAAVTSTDYVPELLEQGRRRAEADGLSMITQIADAEDLPFADESFDVVLSTFGAMFSPDHRRTAGQLLRVTRPGGRIGIANWTPDGFIGQLFRVIGGFIPPPAGLASPAEWGKETRIVELFGPYASDIRTQTKQFNFNYRSAEHWIEFFRSFYGPVHKAFAALDAANQQALHDGMAALLARLNRGGSRALVVPSDYLEVVITKA